LTTTDLAALRRILPRVLLARCPDFELDADIAEAFGLVPEGLHRVGAVWYHQHSFKKKTLCAYTPQPYTSSIDAGAALIRQELISNYWEVFLFKDGSATASIPTVKIFVTHQHGEIFARLAALIKAKIAENSVSSKPFEHDVDGEPIGKKFQISLAKQVLDETRF